MPELDYAIDTYSPLDHMDGMGEDGGPNVVPDWVTDPFDRRRLGAYVRLSALIETVGRLFLADDPNRPDRQNEWREYGDPAVLVDRIAAALIGDDPSIGIIGADRPLPEQPDIPPAPTPPADHLDGEEARVAKIIYDAAVAAWAGRALELLAEWQEDIAAKPTLRAQDAWLKKWADDEHLFGKALEMETENAVPLGDGVYVLGWSAAKQRPELMAYEGDAYFPELDQGDVSTFPSKVHLAWGFTEIDPSGDEIELVRRITYELVPIAPIEGIDDVEPPPFGTGDALKYLDDGEEQTHACLFSDGVFLAEDVVDEGLYAIENALRWTLVSDPLNPAGTPLEAYKLPLSLDFIPVVHIPNTLSTARHFGRSSIIRIAQLYAELAAADTDESFAAELAAKPAFVIYGADPSDDTVQAVPGMGWKAREGGGVSILDLSLALPRIAERIEALLDRISVNGQVPNSIQGRTAPSELPSGLAWTLSFTPFSHLIRRLREARNAKLSLMLKMVQRMQIQYGEGIPGGATTAMPAEFRWGSFMPSDLQTLAVVLEILIRNRILSQETALLMMQQEGIPIEDVRAELAAIRAIMGEEANQQTLATGDPTIAADLLGKRLSVTPLAEAGVGPGQEEPARTTNSPGPADPQPAQPQRTTSGQPGAVS